MHLIAEGVETLLQAPELLSVGCTVSQGFLWSPTVPADEIPAVPADEIPAIAGGLGRAPWRGECRFIDEMLHQIGIGQGGAVTVAARILPRDRVRLCGPGRDRGLRARPQPQDARAVGVVASNFGH